MCEEKKSSGLLDGLLLGGLIGAALGVVFAPATGEKTREILREKFKELKWDELVNRFSEAFEEGKKEAESVMKEVEM